MPTVIIHHSELAAFGKTGLWRKVGEVIFHGIPQFEKNRVALGANTGNIL